MDIIQSAIIFLLLIWVVYQYFRFNRKLEILKTILNARGRNLYLEATKNIEIFQLPNQKPEDVYTKDKRYNDLLNSERLIVLRNVRKKYSNYTDKELKRMINEFYPLSRKQK